MAGSKTIFESGKPFDEGVILDPFMGSGSTIAAAAFLGLRSIGLESNPEYFQLAVQGIPALAQIPSNEINGRFVVPLQTGRASMERILVQ